MWNCPACQSENIDTGVLRQACQACGQSVDFGVTRSGQKGSNEEAGRGVPWWIIVIGLLVAVRAGPAILDAASSTFDSFGTEGSGILLPSSFRSFDAQISECIEEGGEPRFDTTREYTFSFDGRTWHWSFELSSDVNTCLANPEIRDGFGRFDYGQYVTASFDDEVVADIVKSFRTAQQEEGYNDRELAEMILSFVQSLRYATDDVTSPYDEWPRFPLETLYAEGGDCEDTSILYASLIRAMGYGVVMLEPPGHMAVGVAVHRQAEGGVNYNGQFYAYAETTGEGYRIGHLPEAYSGMQIRIIPV